MLNELENKIRKEIPELREWNYLKDKPIQLNHVLEYVKIICRNCFIEEMAYVVFNWNLNSNLLSEQSEELIKYILELKK